MLLRARSTVAVFICLAATISFAAPAPAYKVLIQGSVQYVDAADLGTAGTSFCDWLPGEIKSHRINLSGLTLTSHEPWSAQAFAAADITTGELKIAAAASGAGFATASARMYDDIIFNGPYNGMINGTPCYSIPASFVVNGIISGSNMASAGITINAGLLGIQMHQQVISGKITVFSGLINTTGPLHLDLYINTDGPITGGVADFSHTAVFSWQLPKGVDYTSCSGCFMANPEPATITIFSAAFLALLNFNRKRK